MAQIASASVRALFNSSGSNPLGGLGAARGQSHPQQGEDDAEHDARPVEKNIHRVDLGIEVKLPHRDAFASDQNVRLNNAKNDLSSM